MQCSHLALQQSGPLRCLRCTVPVARPSVGVSRRSWIEGRTSRERRRGNLVGVGSEMESVEGREGGKEIGALLIVGPGVLGTYLAKLWIEQGGSVTGRTNSTSNHPRLLSMGIVPQTNEDVDDRRYPNVVFCAPPSGSKDYPASVKAAVDCWDHSGSFIFTSSIGVYPQDNNVTENASTIPLGENERTDRMLMAENAALEAGGNVVRLAGLYHSGRGPHSFFFSKGMCSRPSNHLLQLIHYQDAAALVLQVLLRGQELQKEIFLAVDSRPLTIQELVDFSVESGMYQGTIVFEKEPYETAPSRDMDNSKTVEMLNGYWSPEYSFESLMKSGGNDWYKSSGLW